MLRLLLFITQIRSLAGTPHGSHEVYHHHELSTTTNAFGDIFFMGETILDYVSGNWDWAVSVYFWQSWVRVGVNGLSWAALD